MSYFAGNAQARTATLLASTFLAQFSVLFLATQFMGPAGLFLAGAMVDGSPLVWLGEPIIGIPLYILGIRLGSVSREALLYLLVFAPYPLLGWLIGYRWPLRDTSLRRLLRAALFRFALVWVPMVAIGLWRVLSQ